MENVKLEAKWGVIMGLVTFVVFILSYLLGWQTAETFNMHLSAAFGGFLIGNIGCLWLGLKEKRKKVLNGKMTYLQGLRSGAIITLIATALGTLFLYFFASFINTGFINALTEFSIANGTMEAGQAMTASAFLKEFALNSTVIGLVFTLGVAFFVKKKGE